MNVSLTPELEAFIAKKLKGGLYQTSSEVVREGLRLLKERDDQLAALRRDIKAGDRDIEQGRFTDYAPSELPRLAAQVMADGRRLLARRQKQTPK